MKLGSKHTPQSLKKISDGLNAWYSTHKANILANKHQREQQRKAKVERLKQLRDDAHRLHSLRREKHHEFKKAKLASKHANKLLKKAYRENRHVIHTI